MSPERAKGKWVLAKVWKKDVWRGLEVGFLSMKWVFSEGGNWVSGKLQVWEVKMEVGRELGRRERGFEGAGFWVLRWFLKGGEWKNTAERDSMKTIPE